MFRGSILVLALAGPAMAKPGTKQDILRVHQAREQSAGRSKCNVR